MAKVVLISSLAVVFAARVGKVFDIASSVLRTSAEHSKSEKLHKAAAAMKSLTSVEWSDIDAAVDAVIAQMNDDVIGHVKSEHVETQTAIDAHEAAISQTDGVAVSKIQTATSAAEAEQQCYGEEFSLAQQWHGEGVIVTAKLDAQTAAWTAKEAVKMVQQTQATLDFTCNALTDIDCVQAKSTMTSAIDGEVARVEGAVEVGVNAYNAKNALYNTATSEYNSAVSDQTATKGSFDAKQTECNAAGPLTETSICEWSVRQEEACAAWMSWEELVSQTQATGNLYSHPDRQSEYSAAKTVICVLEGIKTENANCGDKTFDLESEVSALQTSDQGVEHKDACPDAVSFTTSKYTSRATLENAAVDGQTVAGESLNAGGWNSQTCESGEEEKE